MDELLQVRTNERERLGFRLAGFRNVALDQALSNLASIGYRSVELCLEHPELDPLELNTQKLTQLLKRLSELQLRISSVSFHGKRNDVATTLTKQQRGLEIAQELGVKVLVVGTCYRKNDPEGRMTCHALEALLNTAVGTGVTIAAEPEPETVLDGMYEFSMLAARMAGAPLGLNLDVGHAFLTDGDLDPIIEEWAPFIVHTHLEDIIRPNHVHLLPGDGHIDLAYVVRSLREHGYDGELTLDLYDIEDDPTGWAKQAMERCQRILV